MQSGLPGYCAYFFLDRFEAAHLHSRGSNRFVMGHARPHFHIRRRIQIAAQFLVQLAVVPFLSEQSAQPTGNASQQFYG
ncbi:MAG: hypothetical protein DMG33_07865 [Acidobacteria bacterium]|nr:MAG: hypothetical protein DMG33_07865 [Acidobacteriota bacterium]